MEWVLVLTLVVSAYQGMAAVLGVVMLMGQKHPGNDPAQDREN